MGSKVGHGFLQTAPSSSSTTLLYFSNKHGSLPNSFAMPYMHQYDYIFAIGLLFAALDAYNIGANDVAK